LPIQVKKIDHGEPDVVMHTDASSLGWGASLEGEQSQGVWNQEEKTLHINSLELYAVLLALKSLCVKQEGKHIRLRVDNMTAVHYISNIGGVRAVMCNKIAKEIWVWCMHRHIWLSVAFIKRVDNCEADHLSRVFEKRTEWMLSKAVFKKIVLIWGQPEVDLFASRVNKQIERFVAWRPDPEAFAIDAFSMVWDEFFYAFPPFCLIARCLQKIFVDRAEGVVVVPAWTTQIWFPVLAAMIIDHPRIIFPAERVLQIPGRPMSIHPVQNLRLLVCHVSGRACLSRTFRKRLPTLLWHHGDQALRNSIRGASTSGISFVAKERLITARPL
jgi:ribonuclease HI